MIFFIKFLDDSFSDHHKSVDTLRLGAIRISDFEERFEASLSFWSSADYIAHWRVSLERTINGAEKSCLITSMYDPKSANFIFYWSLYLEDQTVYVQNHLLFLDEINGAFIPMRAYEHVPERRTVSEDGEKISEWKMPIDAIKEFLNK